MWYANPEIDSTLLLEFALQDINLLLRGNNDILREDENIPSRSIEPAIQDP